MSNHLSSILYIEVFLVPLALCLLYFQSTCYCEQCRLVWQQSGVGQLSGGRRGSSCPQSSCPPQLLPTSPFQPPDRAPPTTHQCPPATNFKPGTVPGTRATDKTVKTAADDFLWNERLVCRKSEDHLPGIAIRKHVDTCFNFGLEDDFGRTKVN